MSSQDQRPPSTTSKTQSDRPLVIRVGKRLRGTMNRISTDQSKIPTEPVLPTSAFPWTGGLTDKWQAIADEAAAILRHRDAVPPLREISPDHARIAGDGNWRSFFLIGYGYEVAENCARAPVTAELVRRIPGLNSAFFSILEPGAKIPRHRGVTRGLVTCHLGLIVPDRAERCTMQLEDIDLHWQAGKWLIFDDSYFHQVHNATNQRRVILLLQVKRPMRLLGRLANDLALWGIRRSPFVQDARRNLGMWEEAYRQAEQNEAA
ncbi:aspartyl/asparaginyl beta-hydroxylase domain-containing protein [Sphingorhabdus sp. 109]|jgi:beta-hydroxylase|uniref:aspartyl/asparaginyl beta-hydroxylase domain-containing protein n=1 Tax=Sphingorhabdus sp. 109 TaxID=2653173 RepID=UPI0012F0103D|nr:aspartyl/asparaginyl beta-hydroxylase domain-containing protein [Sphingorhabdus sp. 109]VWX56608.1 Aspartyl/Asparaginyl beta-hydroxylase [Sphingorhabdus sp. 109]